MQMATDKEAPENLMLWDKELGEEDPSKIENFETNKLSTSAKTHRRHSTQESRPSSCLDFTVSGLQ